MVMPLLVKVGLTALGIGVGGTVAVKLINEHKAKTGGKPLLSGVKGGITKIGGVITHPVKISPPGQPQPPGVIVPPPNNATATDPVHAAAAILVGTLSNSGVSQASFADCSNFQSAWNAANPGSALAVDGKYGPKSQAALQSVIAPAIAPPNAFASASSGTVVAVPSASVAPPNPNTDLFTAASNLVAMGSTIPKGSISAVSTFQAAWNKFGPAQPLTVDGKYGPMSQAALQSTINQMGSGQSPPSNQYGGAPTSIPAFPAVVAA